MLRYIRADSGCPFMDFRVVRGGTSFKLEWSLARTEFDQALDNLAYTLGLYMSISGLGTAFPTSVRSFPIRFILLPVLGNSKEVGLHLESFTWGSREFLPA